MLVSDETKLEIEQGSHGETKRKMGGYFDKGVIGICIGIDKTSNRQPRYIFMFKNGCFLDMTRSEVIKSFYFFKLNHVKAINYNFKNYLKLAEDIEKGLFKDYWK